MVLLDVLDIMDSGPTAPVATHDELETVPQPSNPGEHYAALVASLWTHAKWGSPPNLSASTRTTGDVGQEGFARHKCKGEARETLEHVSRAMERLLSTFIAV